MLATPSPVPQGPGIYGWWFRALPADIDVRACVARDGLTLLYVGISPKKPPNSGRRPSRQTLRKRIRTHYTGNAEESTLRRSLGCLLAPQLGINLRRYGSGTRMHFGIGEHDLSRWMDRNAYISWFSTPQPWLLEDAILNRLDLPLNLDQNRRNVFYPILTAARAHAANQAKSLPTLPNPGVRGSRMV